MKYEERAAEGSTQAKEIQIRTARVQDAGKLLEIYTPYVEKTAITFEYEVPEIEEFERRIKNTLERYPYLIVCQGDEALGYAYTGAFVGRAAYAWAAEVSIYLKEDKRRMGIGRKLYEALEQMDCEVRSICGISSVVYLCGKLHLSWEDVCLKSTHGRKANLVGAVRSHEKTFAILSGGDSVGQLCRELQEYGLSHVRLSVGERLGYPEEKITSGLPGEMADGMYDGLCAALIENPEYFGGVRACVEDEEFLRGKAPMTKSEIRSLSVAKLRLDRDAVVYDVGAGTGSVSIEMAMQAADGMVYAIERKEEACSLIEKNKRHFGTPNIRVVQGLAPEAMADLPAPTHAFIGGSAGNLKEIMECLLKKNPRIRMVINTVTLETVSEVINCLRTLPVTEEEIVSVSVARAKGLGAYHLMMGQNPVYIVTCRGGRP